MQTRILLQPPLVFEVLFPSISCNVSKVNNQKHCIINELPRLEEGLQTWSAWIPLEPPSRCHPRHHHSSLNLPQLTAMNTVCTASIMHSTKLTGKSSTPPGNFIKIILNLRICVFDLSKHTAMNKVYGLI